MKNESFVDKHDKLKSDILNVIEKSVNNTKFPQRIKLFLINPENCSEEELDKFPIHTDESTSYAIYEIGKPFSYSSLRFYGLNLNDMKTVMNFSRYELTFKHLAMIADIIKSGETYLIMNDNEK